MPDLEWRKYLTPEAEDLPTPRFKPGLYSYGPEVLGLRRNVVYEGGPEEFVKNNPGLFATGTTSRDEGYFYWGMVKEIGEERVPGKNGMTWYYQSKVAGGSNIIGGAVVDFVVENLGPNPSLGIRIVTPYFHEEAGAIKRGEDFEQQFSLLDNDLIPVDVKSSRYISDPTGRSVIMAVERALRGESDSTVLGL